MAEQLVITADTFEQEVAQHPKLIIHFGAKWHGFCKWYESDVLALQEEFAGRVTFAEVDVADSQNQDSSAAQKMRQVAAISGNPPEFALFRNGQKVQNIYAYKASHIRDAIIKLVERE